MGFGSFIHNFASLVTKDKNDMTIVFAFVCVCVVKEINVVLYIATQILFLLFCNQIA